MQILDLTSKYQIKNLDIYGENVKFHHLGVVVNSRENSPYENLEYIYDPIQKVNVGFYKLNGLVIEVVIPSSQDSPIINAIKNKTYYHHVCFAVPSIKESLKKASSFGIRRISKIAPAKAFQNRFICWCIGKNYGLMELIQI